MTDGVPERPPSAARAWCGGWPRSSLDRPVIGFREWRIEKGLLMAITDPASWPPGVSRAECRVLWPVPPKHPAPSSDCSCGLYAWYDEAGLSGRDAADGDDPYIAGAVVAWGDVELHVDGFRVEYAKPVALALERDLSDGWHTAAREVAHNYGIPLVTSMDLPATAQQFGPPIPLVERPIDPLARFLDLALSWRSVPSEDDDAWHDFPVGSSARTDLFVEAHLHLAVGELQRTWSRGMSYLATAEAAMCGLIAAAVAPLDGPYHSREFALLCVQQATRRARHEGALVRPARLGLWTYGEILVRVGRVSMSAPRVEPSGRRNRCATLQGRILTVPQLLSAADELRSAIAYPDREELLGLLSVLSRSELSGADYWGWLVEGD